MLGCSNTPLLLKEVLKPPNTTLFPQKEGVLIKYGINGPGKQRNFDILKFGLEQIMIGRKKNIPVGLHLAVNRQTLALNNFSCRTPPSLYFLAFSSVVWP